MPKKKPLKGQPEIHEALKGFDIRIDEFGEIHSTFEVDRVNAFLDQTVPDKKLMRKKKKEQKYMDPKREKTDKNG